jgi:SAM-dependent methyltransferase
MLIYRAGCPLRGAAVGQDLWRWEGERIDLPNYLAIVAELGARSVLDVGCGTGNWASMLAERGFEVVGLDPAAASLDVARAKPGGQRVQWIHGDVTSLPTFAVDLATMTGNVSNVFLTQQEWLTTLGGVHAALRPAAPWCSRLTGQR